MDVKNPAVYKRNHIVYIFMKFDYFVFYLPLSNPSDVEHLYIYLSDMCISPLKKCLFRWCTKNGSVAELSLENFRLNKWKPVP